MKKTFFYLLIILMIAVFSLGGCKVKSTEEVADKETVVETKETTTIFTETTSQITGNVCFG